MKRASEDERFINIQSRNNIHAEKLVQILALGAEVDIRKSGNRRGKKLWKKRELVATLRKWQLDLEFIDEQRYIPLTWTMRILANDKYRFTI